MKKSRYRNFLITIISIILSLILVYYLQMSLIIKNQRVNSDAKLQFAVNRIVANQLEETKDWKSYDNFNNSKAALMALMVDDLKGEYDNRYKLEAIREEWEVSGLYVCTGKKIYSSGDIPLKQETYEKLRDGAEYVTDKEVGMCFYSAELADGNIMIIAKDSQRMIASEDYRTSISKALTDIKVGKNGFIAAYERIADNDYSLAFATSSKDFPEIDDNMISTRLVDGFSGWCRIDGKSYFITVKDADKYRIMAVVTRNEIIHHIERALIIFVSIFSCAILLISLFAVFLYQDFNKGRIDAAGVRNKYRRVSGLGLVMVLLITGYISMLSTISEKSSELADKLDSVSQVISQNGAYASRIRNEYKDEYTIRAKSVARMLQEHPEWVNHDSLADIAVRGDLEAVYVFDSMGQTEATSTVFKDFKLSRDPNSQSYVFWNIIKEYDDQIVQELMPDDTDKHNLFQYFGVKRLDAPGMVQIAVRPEILKERLFGDSPEDIIKDIIVEDGGEIYLSDIEDYLADNYLWFDSKNGVTRLVKSRIIKENNVNVCVPLSVMLSESFIISSMTTILCAILIAMFLSLLMAEINSMSSETKANNSVLAATADRVNTPWDELQAESRLGKLLWAILTFADACLVIYIFIFNQGKNDILNVILSEQWERKFSIFSFSYIMIIVAEVTLLTSLLRKIIITFSVGYGARIETFGRMLNSLIKYVTVIGSIFYCLSFIGVDSRTLLASAGLLTLGVSLGAQSLVGDILAGLFIVFEGDFKVGDIVTIDGFRGTVKEIGIRTTKIEHGFGDVKIFRNSVISSVLNMTKQHSYALVDIGIEYHESIERVEEIILKEFPRIREELPEIINGPFYKGISKFDDSAVILRIDAECLEGNRIQLERDMYRQFKLIFDKNGISIPYTHIVVSADNSSEQKK